MIRVNLVQPLANLAGGTKSGRLLMEAMGRRGHDVRILFPLEPERPKTWRPARWVIWWRRRALAHSSRHHLTESTARLIRVRGTLVLDRDVPEADISIGNFWRCREWMSSWRRETGIATLFVRGHFIGPHPDRVAAAIAAPGVNFVSSRYLQQWLEREYGDPNSILVPNGLDDRFYSDGRARPTTPTLGLMFQTGARKGSDTARLAIEAIRRVIPGLRVIAFGATPPSAEWPLPPDTEFHLRPAQEQIPAIYQQCDVWLIPSRKEGFAVPGLEAFGSHTPVVSTLCGGPDEYIQEGINGYLVPVEDHVAMAERVIEILKLPDDRWRQMSEAAYLRSREFTWDRSAEQLEAAIYRILRGEHPLRA